MNNGYHLAYSAYHRYVLDDDKLSRKVLRELDAANHAHASLVEALIRSKYKGKFEEPESVLAAFIKAGELGIAFGHFLAGRCYAQGYGVRKNRRTAARRYREGADQGSISAMLALGTMYRLGDGIAPDPAAGLALLHQAASERVPYSYRYASGRDGSVLDTVFRNEESAQTRAMEQLGMLYRDGADDIAQDIVLAHFWLGLAAQNGSATAKSSLRKLPPAPPPVPRKRRAEPGAPIEDKGIRLNDMDSTAAYLQGKTYSSAPQPDYKRAARYFHIAMQLGHPDAKSAYEEVKATVGEHAFGLFFAGWGAGLQP